MLSFVQFSDIYIDLTVLKSENIELLLEYFGSKYKAIRVYTNDPQAELEDIEAFSYVCDIIRGPTYASAIINDITLRKKKEKHVLVLTFDDTTTFLDTHMTVVSFGEGKDYACITSFINKKVSYDKKLRYVLSTISIIAILWFVAYFVYMEQLPTYLYEGTFGIGMCIFPLVVLVLTLTYGCMKGVFSLGQVIFGILDGIS